MTDPQQILLRLAAADGVHQREAGARFLLRCVKYGCACVLAAFALDVIFHLASGWRLGLLISLVAGALVLLAVAFYLAFVRRNRMEHIARFLEGRDPALGSRLINMLQLREQSRDASVPPLTRDLSRQAVEGYSEELRGSPLERLAWTGELARHCKRAAWALLGFAALLVAFHRISAVEFARFADPFGDHPPYSFTRLEIVEPGPAGTNVLYGGGFVVKAKASGHQPREVFLTSHPVDHPEQSVTLPMFDKGEVGFHQILDNLRSDTIALVHTKDRHSLSKQVRIEVVMTPQLDRTFVNINPPAYTELRPEEKPYTFKSVQALVGSEVRFRLQSNRPLREGFLEFNAGGDGPAQRVKLLPVAENEVSGVLEATHSGRLSFALVDVDGHPSVDTWEGAVTVTHDLSPEIRISEPENDVFVALDFNLTARIDAADDFGLRTVRLHRGLNGVYSTPRVVHYDGIVRDARETLEFDLAGLGVESGDIISLFAEAIDNAPDPHLTRSKTVRLLVISVEEYNDFLREQTDLEDLADKYMTLVDDLRDQIETQRKLAEEAEKLRKQISQADGSKRDDLIRELDGLMANQNELNHKLNKLAEEMDEFVRDEPLYDFEKELQKELREQAESIRQSTERNRSAVNAVAGRSSPAEGSRQLSPEMLSDFKQAAQEQVERLGGVREKTEKQVVDAIEDMSELQELVKDFNQFEALCRVQQEIAAQTQAYNRAGQLSREDQLALKELAATEKQVGEMLDLLADKLRDDAKEAAELFPKAARSGRDLADAIKDARMPPIARQATSEMLAGNGDQSHNLAERLRDEMEKLFRECQGGNCPSGDELDSYLSLLRMRAGRSFGQMSQSRKFGFGKGKGRGMGMAVGMGMSGSSGYAVPGAPKMNVMGNEPKARGGNASARQSNRNGTGAGTEPGGGEGPQVDEVDAMSGIKPVNRESGAVSSEATIEEYSDLVESYFKAITTRKSQP